MLLPNTIAWNLPLWMDLKNVNESWTTVCTLPVQVIQKHHVLPNKKQCRNSCCWLKTQFGLSGKDSWNISDAKEQELWVAKLLLFLNLMTNSTPEWNNSQANNMAIQHLYKF